MLVVTLIWEAPEITWLLVMISPSLVMITPEPVDSPAFDVALISTMLGLTAVATPETVPFWLVGTTLVLVELEATVPVPVSSWMPYAVPPPIAAATNATAASSAMGPRARLLDAGADPAESGVAAEDTGSVRSAVGAEVAVAAGCP